MVTLMNSEAAKDGDLTLSQLSNRKNDDNRDTKHSQERDGQPHEGQEAQWAIRNANTLVDRLEHEGSAGERVPLYLGIEGGAISEQVIKEISEKNGFSDLRASEPKMVPADDKQVEAVFESPSVNGIRLRLLKVRLDDSSEVLLQLEAERTEERMGAPTDT